MDDKKRARVLTRAEIRHLLRVTTATSRHPERDTLILLLGLAAAMRISEIAALEIQDVMLPSGKLRTEVSLTETKGNVPRLAYLTNPKLVSSLTAYLAWRKSRGFGCATDESRYQGFFAGAPLIVTWKGTRYEMCEKKIVNAEGDIISYRAASALQTYVTGLYRAAGLLGATSHSGRRSLASRLIADGHSIDTVQVILGHRDPDVTAIYIQVDERRLREMFEVVI